MPHLGWFAAGGGCGVGIGLGWGWGAAFGSNYIQIEPEFESKGSSKPKWMQQLQDRATFLKFERQVITQQATADTAADILITESSMDLVHGIEPSEWNIKTLQRWLDAYEDGFTCGFGWFGRSAFPETVPSSSQISPARAKLIADVVKRMETLYDSFVPQYQSPPEAGIIQYLPPWSSWPELLEYDDSCLRTQIKHISRGGCDVSAIEGCMNSSFSFLEMQKYLLNNEYPIPCGVHPLDDLRHHLRIVSLTLDKGGSAIMMQDLVKEEGCLFSTRDVRLMLPGGRLKPGKSKVVLLRPWTACSAACTPEQEAELEPYYGQTCKVLSRDSGNGSILVIARQVNNKGHQQEATSLNRSSHFNSTVKFDDAAVPGNVSTAGQYKELRVAPYRFILLNTVVKDHQAKVKGSDEGEEEGDKDAKHVLFEGDWVVLRGLVGRPELNGRVGIVLPATDSNEVLQPGGATSSHAGAGGRVAVRLLDWSSPLKYRTQEISTTTPQEFLFAPSAPTPPPAPEAPAGSLIRVQKQNLTKVQTAPPGIVVAYNASFMTVHENMDRMESMCFMQQEVFPKLMKNSTQPVGLKCTSRHVRMFKRVLEATEFDVPSSQKKMLLGNLDPKWWKMCVLTPTLPPATQEEVALKKLKRQNPYRSCRHCLASDVKLQKCESCKAVRYCSRACQTADWKATTDMKYAVSAMSGKGFDMMKVPKSLYPGVSGFLVEVQNAIKVNRFDEALVH
ncbi:hypothetical protein CEUSTIGMA_g1811.t1 [Chlamydomonas eustigma]|uniref:MYND-type domain-containing protein n=1 Tax=Chlamydomonas eustigma TaxID=1157962 RepID=A0A250WUP9_9CHLO|nr:hypothetical protein CEUSTIGMA_g1811.t1 [Chlamydomonas eustigma]|eukprot:GAX74362.1 hypothetical protein CEUSTIGMA_g1811.t1 [Chlamydomonas eustigma]